jgi:hypothetical protein
VHDKPFVLVQWEDPNSSSVEVITDENIADFHAPEVMETAGWLLRDDEKGVSVANEIYYEKGKPRWRGHTFIVRALIRKVTQVSLAKARKKKEGAS